MSRGDNNLFSIPLPCYHGARRAKRGLVTMTTYLCSFPRECKRGFYRKTCLLKCAIVNQINFTQTREDFMTSIFYEDIKLNPLKNPKNSSDFKYYST